MQYTLVIPDGFKMEDFEKLAVGKLTSRYQSAGKPTTIAIESSAGGILVKEELVIFETIALMKEGEGSHNIEIRGYIKGEKDILDNAVSRRIRGTIDFKKKLLTL